MLGFRGQWFQKFESENGLGDTTKEIDNSGREPIGERSTSYVLKKLFVEMEQN